MSLAFRNLDITPDDPVEAWGFEGLLAAVDRGGLSDWRRIAAEVSRRPRGEVAALLPDVLDAAEDVGVAATLRRHLESVLHAEEQRDRHETAEELRRLWKASGLDQAAYARLLGTSRTRFNTWVNGRTVPLATVLTRARRLAHDHDTRSPGEA